MNARAPRALVIGAGPAATALHLPVLSRLQDRGELTLQLICDLDDARATNARKKFRFTAQTGDAADAVARDDVDVVYIFGSAQLHHEYGLAALRNGKHLFVEKPVAPSYAQARELAGAARARSLIAVGGLNRRFYQALNQIRSKAGDTRWRYAEATFHKPESGKQVQFGARTWLGANGIHALDALLYMMDGLPESLSASASGTHADAPSMFSALMHWGDGSQAVFLCNNEAGARREEYAFHGPAESYSVTDTQLIHVKGGKRQVTAVDCVGDGIEAEHQAFLDAVRGGDKPRHSIESIVPSLLIAELIEQGFNGLVAPRLERPLNFDAQTRTNSANCVLVVNPQGLHTAIERWLPNTRFATVEDLNASHGTRPDITAAILGRGANPLAASLLEKLPRLETVGICALSLERYAPEPLHARDIRIFNASSAYAETVAEFAFALAVLGRRRAFASHEVMRRGKWGVQPVITSRRKTLIRRMARSLRPIARALGLEQTLLRLWRTAPRLQEIATVPLGESRDIAGALVGLIGWGVNARALTLRLCRAQARVIVYSEHATEQELHEAGALAASLSQVLTADIVSLHRGLTAATRHSLGATELDKLKSGSVLINVARGALIEPTALLDRLRKGDIFACLDTFEAEPLPADAPLRKLPNVFLTSHIAGGSRDMHAAAAEEVVRKVADYLNGKRSEGISAARLKTMT